MIFFGVAVVPVIRRPEYRSVFAYLVRHVGARFRVLGWACLLVLVATGTSNLALRGLEPLSPVLSENSIGRFMRPPADSGSVRRRGVRGVGSLPCRVARAAAG